VPVTEQLSFSYHSCCLVTDRITDRGTQRDYDCILESMWITFGFMSLRQTQRVFLHVSQVNQKHREFSAYALATPAYRFITNNTLVVWLGLFFHWKSQAITAQFCRNHIGKHVFLNRVSAVPTIAWYRICTNLNEHHTGYTYRGTIHLQSYNFTCTCILPATQLFIPMILSDYKYIRDNNPT